MKLAELQTAFQNCVLHGARDIEAIVQGTEGFNTATRLGVYEYAFGARLVEAVAKTYPTLRATMGERGFAELIHAYCQGKPPSHFSIRYFGDTLSEFIANTLTGTRARVLSELANWEWLLAASFDSMDMAPLTRDSLASLSPEHWPQLRFKLSPSLYRLALHTNAVQWWKAFSNGSPAPTRYRMAREVEWVIWRHELKTYFRSLKPDEACAVDCVMRNETFATLCEVLAATGYPDNAPLRAATLLSQWFNDGWIVAILD